MKHPLIILALLLTGCADFNRQAQTATTRTVERVGIEQGKPTQITETTTERTASETQAQAGVDVGKAVAAAMAGMRGDLIGVLQEMKPAPVDFQPVLAAISAGKPGLDGTTGTLAGGLVGAGLLAFQQYMAKRKADADADEGWRKMQEAQAREVELAKQLPPPVAKAAA